MDHKELLQDHMNKVFEEGLCPAFNSKEFIWQKLSGEWFMQRSTEYLNDAMNPTCFQSLIDL